VTLHEFAKKNFAAAVGVKIGGVDEVAARFAEGVIDFAGFVFRRAPAPVFAEGHGAERSFGNSKTAVAQKPISHGGNLFWSLETSSTIPDVFLCRLVIRRSVGFRQTWLATNRRSEVPVVPAGLSAQPGSNGQSQRGPRRQNAVWSSPFYDTKISFCGAVEYFEHWPIQVTFIRGDRLL